MADVDELRKRYETLVSLKNEKKKDLEILKTKVAVADARLNELADEAKTLGLASFEELDAAIASEEAAIAADLDQLERDLASDEVLPSVVPTTPVSTDKPTDLDDLLRLGST